MQSIETLGAPLPVGPYSQAVLANGWIFISGQTAKDKQKNTDIKSQTRAILEQTQSILHAAGASLVDVVRVDIFLINMQHFQDMNSIYADFFSHPIKPARTTVQVSRLFFAEALLEISSIAIKKP